MKKMFSRATIMDVMFLLRDLHTHATLDTYAYRYGLGEVAVGDSKDKKVLGIAKHLVENPELPGLLSNNLVYEIVEDVISKALPGTLYFDPDLNEFIQYPQLRRLLLKDGFVIKDGQLIRTFDTEFDYSKNETLLENLLNKHQLIVAKGHYNQASNAFNRGDWAACNSQLRSFVEELLNKLAEKITGNKPTTSHQAKITLSKSTPPIFYNELNEWLDDGTGYFETFWKRLHPHGSHPGLSDEDDSIFRLNLVQISTLEVLKRFDLNFS
jgi:hypothetical protein